MKRFARYLPTFAALWITLLAAAKPPKLVVNIVVGSMRAGDIERYADGFGEGGFKRLLSGAVYAAGEYDFMQSSSPVTLATLSTGAMPSTHGVVTDYWFDYVDNRRVNLIEDRRYSGFGYPDSGGRISPVNLTAPTAGDALTAAWPDSRVVTVALEPQSAVVMGGLRGVCYWMEPSRAMWSSSTYYMLNLPHWVDDYNRERYGMSLISGSWSLSRRPALYKNRRRAVVELPKPGRDGEPVLRTVGIKGAADTQTAYDMLRFSPAGNDAVLDFAKRLLTKYSLGADAVPDMLNIVLDASRMVVESYGPESVEAEDMYYRLDDSLSDFLTYLFAQVSPEDVLVVLTAAHGSSPSYDVHPTPAERVNMRQAEVIVNGFLNARHGQGEWVTSVHDRSIWLNRNLIFSKGLNPADIQEEVATFTMQLRGVSHALSSAALRNGGFGTGYGRMMQNGFYPRRSGDVVLNLMPGCIEERDDRRSESGSMYGYDTRVPLIFYGHGISRSRHARHADMTSVAPTIASVLGILPPEACEGHVLEEILKK